MSPVVPVNIKTVTVVGTYLRLDGTPLQGTVTFHAPSVIISQPSNLALSGDVTVPIQPDGTISAVLLATDDPNISPTGFTYQVTEAFTNAQGRTYNVALSYQAAQPIDLMPVTPSSPNAGNVTYVAGPGVPSGGSAGSLLFKNSGADFDTSWKSPAAAGVLALSGGTMTGAVTTSGATAGAVAEQTQVSGDGYPRFQQLCSGGMFWGPGNAAGDTNLYRAAIGLLKTDYSLSVAGNLGVGQAPASSAVGVSVSTDNAGVYVTNTTPSGNVSGAALVGQSAVTGGLLLGSQVSGDAFKRFKTQVDGRMQWGPGTVTTDTNLYRSAAGVLATDGSLTVGGTVSAGALYSANTPPFCYGFKAWTIDPVFTNSSSPGNGNLFLNQFVLTVPGVISTVFVPVITAGSGLTAGKNLIGIYNGAGTLISNAVALDTVLTSTGLKAVAITVNAGAAVAAGLYYVGVLVTGTTMPLLLANINSNVNLLASGGPRSAFIASQAALPASFNPATVPTTTNLFYFGVN